jgi:hypothetical protein
LSGQLNFFGERVGNSVKGAKENLKDAVRGFLLSAHKKGGLHDILEEA